MGLIFPWGIAINRVVTVSNCPYRSRVASASHLNSDPINGSAIDARVDHRAIQRDPIHCKLQSTELIREDPELNA